MVSAETSHRIIHRKTMTARHSLTRKDRLHLIGRRAQLLTDAEIPAAWRRLCHGIQELASYENHRLPKFDDLLELFRKATIDGRRKR